MSYDKKIVIVGGGVAGICAATKLVDNGYSGNLITIIDKGKDPYKRHPEETMVGMLGAGGWSDGKLTYHTSIGGQLSKYCGEEKAYELMDQVIENFRRFHPKPEEIFLSNPQEEPEFIKPYFRLRLFPVWHIGSNYLHEISKNWYQYLVSKGIRFIWQAKVDNIDFNNNLIIYTQFDDNKIADRDPKICQYDRLVFAVGKSGIDLTQKLIEEHNLSVEQKSVQLGVRFESPQKYFQKLVDISYDFKLYQKHGNVSLRTFCTNNNSSFIAVEETYGDISYNGHAIKDKSKYNGMTNFGILMEIRGIDNPFEWSRKVVKECQAGITNNSEYDLKTTGIYYSPNNKRSPSKTSEEININTIQIPNLEQFKKAFGKYSQYILNFIDQMNEVFEFGDDWGIYIPEVKYVASEPIVNYNNLSLINYPNIHFVGDSLSARGISVSGAQGIYVASSILKK